MRTFKRSANICFCMLFIVLLSAFCASCGTQNNKGTSYEIAMVGDIGEFMDGGFNKSAYEGIKNFATKNNKTYIYYQPGNGTEASDKDRIFSINQAIEGGAKIILLPGVSQIDALKTAAKANPNVKFVFIDGGNIGMDNVTSVSYKEEEAGYLAGYAAVMDGYTKLGGSFGGGGAIAACNRFAYGYVQGADAAAKSKGTDVSAKISFKYGSTFSASEELKTQISNWYQNGTEVVFSCGGAMFDSVRDACAENGNGKIIGVDSDRSSESDTVITSAMKGIAASVERILEEYYNGEWDEKLSNTCTVLGVADGAVRLPTNAGSWRFENFTLLQYEEILNQIKSGEITIKSETPDDMNSSKVWNVIDEELTNITIDFE